MEILSKEELDKVAGGSCSGALEELCIAMMVAGNCNAQYADYPPEVVEEICAGADAKVGIAVMQVEKECGSEWSVSCSGG